MMKFSADGRELIAAAARQARSLGHSYVGTIHILLALLEHLL